MISSGLSAKTPEFSCISSMSNTKLKLTKTEREMLERAVRDGSGTVTAMHWYVTHTKAGLQGTRSTSAIRTLHLKGLVGEVKHESRADCGPVNSVHSTEFWAKITDAGREAIR